MINKIRTSSAPTTYKATTGQQEWGVAKNASETPSSPSTGTQAWGVKNQNDVTPETQSNKSQLVKEAPKSTLNPLSYGTLGSHWNSALNTQPLPFQAPKLDTPQAVDTWNTVQATTFMPVQPSLGGLPLNTPVPSIPYNGANGSLGTNVLASLFKNLT